jgi:hypothetical protein
MTWLKALLALSLVGACVAAEDEDLSADMDLADEEAAESPLDSAKADAPGWQTSTTLHANTRLFDHADPGVRRVHSLWLAGTASSKLPVTLSAVASEGYDVRIALLGPIGANGVRPVLAADGYASKKRRVSISLNVATTGEHLVVLGSYNLVRETFYDLAATCTGTACTPDRVDTLALPKDGALVGNSQRLIQMQLGTVIANTNSDIEVELWASPPMQHWNATKVASAYASGTQVNIIAPSSVRWGDDVRLVVREPSGRILDSGITTRFLPTPTNLVRFDAILYGDIASLQIAGSTGFFEGQADLRLRSVTRNRELAQFTAYADRPGMVGNGFNAFDATFMPDLSVAARDGELLSVGRIDGNGTFRRLGCFEYCNNLSGLSSCTGGARTCPN